MNYKHMVEVAGKAAGRHIFNSVGRANENDPDLSIAVALLKEAFPKYDEDVIENDVLWCQDAEFERLQREQRAAS